MDQSIDIEGGEKWSYILKVEPPGFVDELVMGCERKKEPRMAPRFWDRTTGKNRVAIN